MCSAWWHRLDLVDTERAIQMGILRSEKSPERVLVFGDDMRIFLAVVRSLGRAGKEVHAVPFNWQAPALKSKYVHAVHRVPRFSDSQDAWRDAVLKILRNESFSLVLPNCDDRSILAFDRYREEFSGYRVAIPNQVSMQHLFDKQCTRELCAQLGIDTVPGARLEKDDDAQALVARYGLPLVVKPRRSYWPDKSDSWGKVYIAEHEDELAGILAKLGGRSRYLVEGYFAGVGVGVSVLAQNGHIQHAFQHRRLREGWGGSSSYRVSEAIDQSLREACAKICKHTEFTGVCMFEFRWNESSKAWVLLETNARFWGSIPLPLSLGVDFPRYLYDLMVSGRVHPPAQYATGIRSRNFVLDGFNLVRGLQRSTLGAWLGELARYLTQPLGWLTGRERSDSLVVDDLRPAISEWATLLKSVGQKLTRGRAEPLARRRGERVA